jgi:carbon storage regulator
MLVLTRQLGKSLIITQPDGTQITVTVQEVRGPQVRLGVEAPRHISVHRSEIHAELTLQGRSLNLNNSTEGRESSVALCGDRPEPVSPARKPD